MFCTQVHHLGLGICINLKQLNKNLLYLQCRYAKIVKKSHFIGDSMKKWIIGILILVLIVLITGIYFIYSSKEQSKDPEFYKENWAYEYLNIDVLHNEYKLDGYGIKVALIDTGVSKNITNVVEGINVLDGSINYEDDHGHGTHLAGILSSEDFGVAPKIELYVAKALSSELTGEINNIIEAVKWSIDKDVDIILMPFGTPKDSVDLKNVIDKAIAKDILIVSSVGNYGLQGDIDVLYPAKYTNVIGVGALDKKGEIWKGTTKGEGLDFLLPGQFISSYSITGDKLVSSGTSMASAYMAGLLSLYVEKNKETEGNLNKMIWEKMENYDKIDGYFVFRPEILLK